jgi:tetratricopeptide (TPR) repeat protein
VSAARDPGMVQRAVAYSWYLWGASLCYWGIRTAEARLFRAGVGAYTQAIRVWPEFSGAYLRRATIRSRELGEHRAAIEDLNRALAFSPELAEIYLQRGLIQRFHGDPQAAIADLEQFITLAAGSPWRAEAERQIAMLREEHEP